MAPPPQQNPVAPSLPFDSRDEPGLGRVLRLGDDPSTRGALGHPLRHKQRDGGTTKTEHGAEHQQAAGAAAINAQYGKHYVQHHAQHVGPVGFHNIRGPFDAVGKGFAAAI
mgnify:CR=1 FL=1